MATQTQQISSHLHEQSIAQLNTMGIMVYQPLQQFCIEDANWLITVCELLGIQRNDCIFNDTQIEFNPHTKKLHLPQNTYMSENALKKAIWTHIRPFVD